jgi:2'-5' RNA ligase
MSRGQGEAAQRAAGERSSAGGDLRAFIAVDLDAAARAAAAEILRRLRGAPGGDSVRWVRPEALHVTLRFLGQIAPAQVEPLARAVGAQLAGLVPFALALGAVTLFPSPRRPRVVALEVGPQVALAELARAVERGVAAQGFAPEERPFRAHLTLGRVRNANGRAAALAPHGLAAPVGSHCPVSEVVLYRSELRPEGSLYTPLERIRLGGASPTFTPFE